MLKLKIWIKQIYQRFISRKNIIILIGNNGAYLVATKNDKYVASLFIPLGNRENVECYKSFFKDYADFHIFFLVEDENCELKHESIPTLQSVIEINPVKLFISEHYNSQDIVSFKVGNINSKSGETWDTIISRIPYIPPISTLLNYVISNNLKFGGIYHLSLEYINIINNILKKHRENSSFQIFVYNSQANAIKFVIKQNDAIIAIKSVNYPISRTKHYIQGIIEQEVNDYLAYYKNHIIEYHLQVCLILLVDHPLKILLLQSELKEINKMLCLTNSDFTELYTTKKEEQTIDNVLIKLFFKNKTFLGSNRILKSIARVNLVNFVLVRILNIIMIILIVIILDIRYFTYKMTLQDNILDQQKYQVFQKYRDIEQQYSNIKNSLNSADLYNLFRLSDIPAHNPFKFLEKLTNNLTSNVDIEQVNWQINMINDATIVSNYVIADVSIKYNSYSIDHFIVLKEIEDYKEKIRANFNDFLLCCLASHDNKKFLDRVVTPLSFSIKIDK
ncbi:MAG: hypothetical protein EOP33_04590 [Rickettsiaceae bacterium]|nr:MAG: hypothetical protein EOP33_04590 [Rickettsiaceae bacterium]